MGRSGTHVWDALAETSKFALPVCWRTKKQETKHTHTLIRANGAVVSKGGTIAYLYIYGQSLLSVSARNLPSSFF